MLRRDTSEVCYIPYQTGCSRACTRAQADGLAIPRPAVRFWKFREQCLAIRKHRVHSGKVLKSSGFFVLAGGEHTRCLASLCWGRPCNLVCQLSDQTYHLLPFMTDVPSTTSTVSAYSTIGGIRLLANLWLTRLTGGHLRNRPSWLDPANSLCSRFALCRRSTNLIGSTLNDLCRQTQLTLKKLGIRPITIDTGTEDVSQGCKNRGHYIITRGVDSPQGPKGRERAW